MEGAGERDDYGEWKEGEDEGKGEEDGEEDGEGKGKAKGKEEVGIIQSAAPVRVKEGKWEDRLGIGEGNW